MSVVINSSLQSTTTPRMLNINEASKACSLSPSVLRIWELRYGWPNPKRKANGYRSYSPHLVEDLKRMAELVKTGTPIRQLIVDGLPRWPVETDCPTTKPRTIDYTKSLIAPKRPSDARLQKDIQDALETRRPGQLHELIQRCQWQVRPQDEAATCLAPILAGMAELRSLERPMAGGEADLKRTVEQRSRQLLKRFTTPSDPVWVVPASEADNALAHLATLLLYQRDIPSAVVPAGEKPSGRYLTAGGSGDPGEAIARISEIEAEDCLDLATLLDTGSALPEGI